MSFLSRSIVRRVRVPHRTFITVQLGPSGGSNSRWLLTLSGFAGGAVATAAGGYAIYRWSGIGDIVDKVRRFTRRSEQRNDSQNETAAQLFSALRMLAKAYVAGIPGAGILVDTAFDQVGNIVDSHQEEARTALKSAMEDIQKAVKARGTDSKTAAWDVLIILRDKLGQIQASASASAEDQNKIGTIFENFRGYHEHASQRVPEVRASMSSLLSAGRKRLEKGKDFLLDTSERRKSGSDSIPSAEEASNSSNSVEGKPSTQDSFASQNSGNVA
ncbi:hypothetical protein Agabi119p4_2429 [Agaricus bisporus var. burnettii]|uniref:Uncharacterized protein n=1 Tax=Agaricus bisporus var. burnettii TaxID=192524 RepID=A0A8H7F971_AGABI|nr:hypothetical protein Agabi119p4_2429 [Agaricus bisporus var. burnettii]